MISYRFSFDGFLHTTAVHSLTFLTFAFESKIIMIACLNCDWHPVKYSLVLGDEPYENYGRKLKLVLSTHYELSACDEA